MWGSVAVCVLAHFGVAWFGLAATRGLRELREQWDRVAKPEGPGDPFTEGFVAYVFSNEMDEVRPVRRRVIRNFSWAALLLLAGQAAFATILAGFAD